MDGTVLVADDDRTIRTVLTQALTRAGCKVHATSSLVTLMRWVDEGKGDLVISDVVMPDGNGLEQLPDIAARRPGLPVIVISAQNTIMTAIQAAEAEAYDYLPKPFDLPDLMKRAARALEIKRHRPPEAPAARSPTSDLPLVGQSRAMQDIYRLVARVLHTDMSVLVTGESGTGKSLIARTIHDLSDRRGLPFVVAGASDLDAVDGASTLVARARGGTLLLDEVSDFPEEAQARLVRLLDALPDDDAPRDAPRILATSQGVAGDQGPTIRQDLYYRLSGVTIDVPSLRERVDDITDLADHFLAQAEAAGLPARRLSAQATDLIRRYTWPGNLRQLDNVVRRLAATSQTGEITATEVEAVLSGQPSVQPVMRGGDESISASVMRHLRRYFDLHGGVLPPPGLYARILREVETPLIEIALDATGGNQAKCADLLGINRNTLRKKISDLDIHVTRRRKLM